MNVQDVGLTRFKSLHFRWWTTCRVTEETVEAAVMDKAVAMEETAVAVMADRCTLLRLL